MKIVYFLFVLGLAGTVFGDGVNWALLVAGSNEYYNYRHQADICHAYQIMHRNGIPDERIVVMMYDDIAQNSENPTKGKIINKPNGPDVYNGTLKDYTKGAVTPSNFLKVLQGKSQEMLGVGSGKVINSGPNDNVFVFFSDHGAPGIVAFPDGSALHASQLNSAIKTMYTNKQFKNLVVYIEACESGSMFENLLPENINVFATTASNSEESSYATYWDEKYQAYLGDLYSVSWMEDSDKQDISKETLQQQFVNVRAETNLSHVMEYGDLTMGNLFVGQFQGESSAVKKPAQHIGESINRNIGAVRTEDVRLSTLHKKLERETSFLKRAQITAEIKHVEEQKRIAIGVIREIAAVTLRTSKNLAQEMFETKKKLTKHECYVPSVDYLVEKCFSLKNEYVLRNLYILVNLCESGVKAEQIKSTIDVVCQKKYE